MSRENKGPSVSGNNKYKPCYCYETIGEFLKNAHCIKCGFQQECYVADLKRIKKNYEDDEDEQRELEVKTFNEKYERCKK